MVSGLRHGSEADHDAPTFHGHDGSDGASPESRVLRRSDDTARPGEIQHDPCAISSRSHGGKASGDTAKTPGDCGKGMSSEAENQDDPGPDAASTEQDGRRRLLDLPAHDGRTERCIGGYRLVGEHTGRCLTRPSQRGPPVARSARAVRDTFRRA